MSIDIAFLVLLVLFAIAYVGTLISMGKEMKDLPEKIDKILRNNYEL